MDVLSAQQIFSDLFVCSVDIVKIVDTTDTIDIIDVVDIVILLHP